MRILILLPALLLAACGGGEDGTQISITGDNGSGFKAGVGKDGEVSIDTPGFKGSINLPKLQLDAGDFEINGVNLPAGSKITNVNIDSDKGDNDRMVVNFSSPVTTTAVREWFQGKLTAEGFKLTAAGDNLSGTTDDGKGFRLTTKAAGNGASESTISIGS